MDITELGAQLRQQREHLGFSLQEVAESTKVSKRILVAFEEGDRDHFPHRVYAKGFVQSYAKVLGLDPREFGEAMEQALRPCDGAPAAPIRPEVCAPAARRGWGIWLLALLLAALLAFLVWYFFIRPAHPVALEGFTPESAGSAGAAPASAEAPAPPVEVVPAAEPSAPAV
ncbi:MAG: helix-turn-helix domain-containing protein, partial [Desulfovibrionaceae bacterium]